jgi:hypothetical protein
MEWFQEINPSYRKITEETYASDKQKLAFLKESITSRISLWIPPSLNTINLKNILKWYRKWEAFETPVTFVKTDQQGNKRTFRTLHPVCIGAKYIYLLCKIPHVTSAGVAHVSHTGTPNKPGRDAKYASTVSQTPVKVGEDENRVAIMDVAVEEVVRLTTLSNSPTGARLSIEEILHSPYPTQIKRFPISNEDLSRTNSILAAFHHLNSVLGIETRQTRTTELSPDFIRDDSDMLIVSAATSSDLSDERDDDNEALIITPVTTIGNQVVSDDSPDEAVIEDEPFVLEKSPEINDLDEIIAVIEAETEILEDIIDEGGDE